MRHHCMGVVIALLDVPAPVRLKAHQHVAEDHARNHEAAIGGVELSRGIAPALLDASPGGFGELRVVPAVVLLAEDIQCPPRDLLVGHPVHVVRQPLQQDVDELAGSLGDAFPDVVAVIPHPLQQIHHTGEGVQSRCAAGVGCLRRIHIEQDRNLPLGIRDPPETTPHHCRIRYAVGAVPYRPVHAGPVRRPLCGTRGDGDDLPVELRMGDVVGDLRWAEAVDVPLPRFPIRGERHRLDHRHPVGREEVLLADLLPAARGRDQRLGEAHGLDDAVQHRVPIASEVLGEYPLDAD